MECPFWTDLLEICVVECCGIGFRGRIKGEVSGGGFRGRFQEEVSGGGFKRRFQGICH